MAARPANCLDFRSTRAWCRQSRRRPCRARLRIPHAATIAAIKLAARLEALVLDPVYSGKGMAGLIALIREGRWKHGEHVVFVHTGGAPAIFAYRHLFDPE